VPQAPKGDVTMLKLLRFCKFTVLVFSTLQKSCK